MFVMLKLKESKTFSMKTFTLRSCKRSYLVSKHVVVKFSASEFCDIKVSGSTQH